MSEHTITIDELKKLITENKIHPSMLFDEKRLCADPEVLKLKAAAEAKLKAEIEAEEDNADHIPGDDLPDLSLNAGHPKKGETDHSADHIPDNGDGDNGDADHIPD